MISCIVSCVPKQEWSMSSWGKRQWYLLACYDLFEVFCYDDLVLLILSTMDLYFCFLWPLASTLIILNDSFWNMWFWYVIIWNFFQNQFQQRYTCLVASTPDILFSCSTRGMLLHSNHRKNACEPILTRLQGRHRFNLWQNWRMQDGENALFLASAFMWNFEDFI